ncbi:MULTISPECIES: hypothetical protein, partial [unclassified Microcoleus]|uniref:hypothetical protein n=1 Tax=unclassified Microcoleus TaxID=2642155 RepID=UPI0025D8EE81
MVLVFTCTRRFSDCFLWSWSSDYNLRVLAVVAAQQSGKKGSPDFMVYNVTNNTFTVMDFYLDYILDLPGVK